MVWEGADALREHLVPIGDLHPHPRNPWRGNVKQIGLSLKRFGQVRPVLAQPDGTIVAGNHTRKAALELGWTHIAVVRHEFADADEARDYLLADNRLPELGGYDRAELVAQLDELAATGSWEGTGYQPGDLDHLRALEEAAAAPPPPPFPSGSHDPPGPVELREVVLLLDAAQHGSFGGHIRILRTELGLEGVTETVLAAVHAEARRVNQETS